MIRTVIDRLEEGAIALLMAAMTLLTFIQVVMRYGFNSGIDWGLEVTEFIFAWLVLFGMSYGVKKNAHIGIDALVRLFAPGPKRAVGLIVGGLCITYAVLLTIGGYETVTFYLDIGIESEDTPIKLWLIYFILPAGGALLAWRFFQVFWRILSGAQAGFTLADEAREAIETIDHETIPPAPKTAPSGASSAPGTR